MIHPSQKTALDRLLLLAGNTLLIKFAKEHKVTLAELRTKPGRRELVRIRGMAMETLHQAGFNNRETGEFLNRSPAAVSRQLNGGHGD